MTEILQFSQPPLDRPHRKLSGKNGESIRVERCFLNDPLEFTLDE